MYTNSNGDQIDPKEMPLPYLQRALAKAQAENNTDNIAVLQAEMDKRNNE